MSCETGFHFLESMAAHLSEGLFVLDQEGRILFMNPEAERLLGWSRDEIIGKVVHDVVHREAAEGGAAEDYLLRKSVTDNTPYRTDNDFFMARDGHKIPVAVIVTPLREVGSIGNLMLFHDISEQRKAEELTDKLHELQEQLIHSEKLASIGSLAAGVAHEINNPVGYVNSNLGALQRYMADIYTMLDAYKRLETVVEPDNPVLQEVKTLRGKLDLDFVLHDMPDLLSESQEGINRVRQIVQDLKDFSRVNEAQWIWADLHKGLDSALNMVNHEIKYKAKVIKEYSPSLPAVECIASQLNQVFMNVLVNAAHAIPDYGTITIRTRTEPMDHVVIEISDTGTGIDPAIINRIFDPFFTTKPVGEGTGLGLSLAKNIVVKHGGMLSVESEVGKGTTFRISLPVKQEEPKANE